MTTAELIAQYRRICTAKGTGKSTQEHITMSGKVLESVTDDVRDFSNPDTWDTVRERMLEKDWGERTLHTISRSLVRIARFAEECGETAVGSSALVHRFNKKTPPLPACTDEEFEVLLAGVTRPSFKAALCLGYDAGLRTIESAGLKVEDIDLDRCTITIRAGKGGKGAVLPILTQRLHDALAIAIEKVPKHGHIALGPRAMPGKRAHDFYYQLHRTAARLGLRRITFHDLRRGFATWSVTRGLEGKPTRIEFVSQMLRHSSVAQTEQYIERLPSNAEVIREGYGGRPPLKLDTARVHCPSPWAPASGEHGEDDRVRDARGGALPTGLPTR
jgi:integrase